jgi:uncharacterized repeat protein (TIGR01451 family)
MVRTAVAAASLLASGLAAATLVVTPLTWNIVGLDSNNPATGPRYFPVGARICSSTATTNVVANFVWDSANANINTRPGSLTSITVPTLAAGACTDAYFEIEVTQTPAAFDTTRRYRIAATDGTGTVSTPVPREIYVERLVSQARNEVSDVQLNGVSVLPGATMTLMVGGTYDIKLVGATATQGYNQLESFINFPNTIFRVLAVSTTYTADSSIFLSSPNDRLYADACGWENHPSSPNYRSCVGVGGVGSDGKAGGGVVTTYTVQVVSGAGTTQPLNTLIYDFSGSSFHYNGDYAVGARLAQIVAPVSPTFAKAFAPSTVLAGGSTVLTLSIGNANPTALTNVAFIDVLPASPAPLLIAAAPAPILSGCGAATLTATAGTATISLANASVAANSSCTVSVPIVVPAAPLTGSYNNITGPLSVNGTATTITASATLNAINSPPPSPGACSSTVDIARWTMDAGQGLGVPPAPSYINPLAAAATASFSGSNSILSGTGSPANSWGGTGWNDAGIPTSGVGPYFQVSADTGKFYGVRVVFDANPAVAGDWGNAGNNSVYVWSSADGGAYSSPLTGFPLAITKNTWTAGLSGTAAATGTSTTAFRVSINGANKVAATFALDNIRIVGCAYPSVPTLTKAFAPNPITVGGTSTLTFTLTNPNTVPLTGAAFADQLPTGVVVAPTVSAVSTCGSPTWAPSAGASTLSFSGGTIPASGSCTASVNVTATSAGAKLNISDFITTTQSGANTTSSGVATATLNVDPIILPPVAAKSFAPAAVVAGQTSILTITLQNPNTTTTLTSAQLVDIYPGDLLNANPLLPAVINGCGGTLTVAAGGSGFSLVGVSLAPNASCSIEIPVAAATVGAKVNTTAAPQSTEGGAGTATSATLTVGAAAPALSLSKRVGETATGPWFDFAVVSPTAQVYYQFTVENIGNVPFASFSVNDPLLAGAGANPAGCVWQTVNAPTTLPGLPVATATLDPTAVCVRGPVPATTGAVVNTATATGVYNAANYTNVDDATYVGADPNLSLIKEISTSATGPWLDFISGIAPGTSLYYRFTIINNGAQPVTGLSITDAMVSTASCTYVDPLPVGDASICIAGPVIAAGAPGATVTNTATVNGTSGGSPVSDTDTAAYALTPPFADVSVVKTLLTAGPFVVGQTISYSLVVANGGPNTATSVQVTDTPTNLTITGVSGGGCAALPCSIVSLASGANVTITVTATINAAGAFDNTATVSATETDPNPGNNTDNTGNGGTASALSADLSITKTDGVATVTAGGSLVYTIVASNAGPNSVSGATVADTFPVSLTGVAWTCAGAGGGVCPASGSGNINATVDLPVGGSVTFTVNTTVALSAVGSIANTATVTSGTSDPVPGNNSATDTTTVSAAPNTADLQVTKSNGVNEVSTGASIAYMVTVTNLGPDTVTGAVLHDPPAIGVAKNWVICSSTPSVCVTPPSVAELESGTFALPTLVSGQSYQLMIMAAVTAATGSSITNSVTVAAPVGITDPVPGNDFATDVDPVVAVPSVPVTDLSLTKTRLGPLVLGSLASYEIVVANAGPAAVTGARVYDYATAGLSSVSWTCAVTAAGAGPVTTACSAASGTGQPDTTVTLNPGGAVRFLTTGTVTGAPGSSTVNTASVAVPLGIVDTDSTNNIAASAASIDTNADIAVSKADAVSTVLPGSQTSYTISIANLGPHAALNVSWTDTLPAGTTFVSLSSVGGWTCVTPAVGANGTVTCSNSSTPPGSSTGFLLTVAMDPGLAVNTVINNTVTVTSTTPDPVPGNNTATDSNTVVAAPATVADLAVTKTNGTAPVTAGQASTYTMVITNNGPEAAPNATLTDNLPAQMTFTSLTAPGGWNCTTPAVGTAGAVSCSTPSMAAGVTATFVLSVTVVPSTPGGSTISNTVNVNSGAFDPVLSNNQATDTDTVIVAPVTADLAIAKSNGGTQLVAGGSTTYTLTVTNLGPDEVAGAVVTDIAPAGLAFASWTCTVANPGAGGTVTTACVTGSGMGNVNATVNLKAGAVATFSVAATVASNAGGSIGNTATINAPAGVTDPALGNNTATDTDTIAAGPPPVVEVPTLSEWALAVMSLFLAVVAMRSMRVRRR